MASPLSPLQEVDVELAAASGCRICGPTCGFPACEVPLVRLRIPSWRIHKVSFAELCEESRSLGDIWTPVETNTHQDHVIAHVLGATALAYFILDEVLYVLLDIGFVWTIFLDGEMGLLPHPVAVSELEVDSETREQIKADVDAALAGREEGWQQLKQPPIACLISEVSFFGAGDQRRLVVSGEPGNLEIETSLATGSIQISSS